MAGIADVVRRHGPEYVERYGASMLPSHKRAMTDILQCRTPALGGHLAVCTQCNERHLLFHSCGNRACPRCGRHATEQWLAGQHDLLLPVPYFHLVFTLPEELRRLVRSHQKELLPVLFKSAYAALAKLCADERYLGGQIGALAVLHTWTRTLNYHPHVHMLVPGGALDADEVWRGLPRRRKMFLVPVRALARVFAAKFLAGARRALPGIELPHMAKKRWVVFAKPVVRGAKAVLNYLGRYVHRTAIGDSAIIDCGDETVTFRYRDSSTHESKTMTLGAHEFLRRFLQHTLPKGLHRVRCYGLLHPAHRTNLRRVQLLLAERGGASELPHPAPSKPPRCPSCGARSLQLVLRLTATECYERIATMQILAAARAPPMQPCPQQ